LTTIGISAGVISQETNQFSITNFAMSQAINALQEYNFPAVAAGVVVNATKLCKTGTVSRSFNDADNSNTISPGDSLELVFNNCVGLTGPITDYKFNGGLKIVYGKVVGTGAPGTDYDVTINVFQGLDVTIPAFIPYSYTGNGTMTLTETSVAGVDVYTTAAVPSYRVNNGIDWLTYTNYLTTKRVFISTNTYTQTLEGALAFATPFWSGSVTFSTPTPFKGLVTGFPDSGQVVIIGGDATLTATAIDATHAKTDLDMGSDGTIEDTRPHYWGAL
jgi:hypothetical protein